MKQINIDIETYSGADLSKTGVYRYSEDPAFEILLFGYSIDQGPVQVIDVKRGEAIPDEVLHGIKSEDVLKYAYNAQFERICLSRFLKTELSPKSWRCTMVASLYLGLPGSLASVGAVLGLEKQKLTEGKELIKFFCVPCKATKANGYRTRNLPCHDLEKWDRFKAYNLRDVETEMEIAERVSRFPVPDQLWEEYVLDQTINDRGIGLDMVLADAAMVCDKECHERYMRRSVELTGLTNPNSPIQLKEWLMEHGVMAETLSKKDVAKLLPTLQGETREVLVLRSLLAKSSVKKYAAMRACVCKDGRANGLLQFYGASRTGRWAGRLIQVQNLPQNHIPDLEVARNLIRSGCFEAADVLYASVPDLLSQLIRTAFVPKAGHTFLVADFSAIEARVLSWIAGEQWRMEVFAKNGDIYCASASQMFGVPVEKHGINGELRQKGKIAELALGYGGGVGALKAMGALEQGLKEEELQPLVMSWRESNPHIVKFWWAVDKAVLSAVKDNQPTNLCGLHFWKEAGFLMIRLLSGRCLFYAKPRIMRNDFGREEISYEGVGNGKRWERIMSYGPKFTENLIQAISRDILAEAMARLEVNGYRIVMHVHDEAVIEAPIDADLSDACQIMGRAPSWAPGLILNAAGYACAFYQKD